MVMYRGFGLVSNVTPGAVLIFDGQDYIQVPFTNEEAAKDYIDKCIRSGILKETLMLQTPGGDICAKVTSFVAYPAVSLMFDNRVIATLEWSEESKKFQLVVYDNSGDDPVAVYKDVTP